MHRFTDFVQQLEERFSGVGLFPEQPQGLYDPCRYLLAIGGKRVRPALCLMGNEMFTPVNDDAWHAATAIELFHNFTLVHDDIMDKAPLRRGKETIHAKYGLTAGILSGDILCIYAYKCLANIKKKLPEIFKLFNQTAIEVCEGQQLDMDFETRNDVTIDEYINMITLKTSVLLACSLKIGAVAGGASTENAEKIYEFGKDLGIAFQLQDDYLDAFGDAQKLGKQNGGDIKANKKTYLLLKALGAANAQQKARLEVLLQSDDDDKVQNMLALYSETKADEDCRKAVQDYSDRAFRNLEEIDVDAANKQPLFELASYLLQRDK